jgi:hypothetical protein
MSQITIVIDLPDGHPWASRPGSLVVADDSAEVIVSAPDDNPPWSGIVWYRVSFWQYDDYTQEVP